MSKDHTRPISALTALLRSNELGIDARKALGSSQIAEVSRWRDREEELTTNEKQLDELVKASEAAPLLEEKGFRAISAAS